MSKLYKLKEDKEYITSSKITNFLNPEYSCILLNRFDNLDNIKSVIKNKIIEKDNKDSYSSISGDVIGLVNVNIDNVSNRALFIKNDFKEERVVYSAKKKLDKESLLDLFRGTKYYKLLSKVGVSNIIVNCICDELYVRNNDFLIKNYRDDVIDTLDDLVSILNIDSGIFTFKNSDANNITSFASDIGSYVKLNISVLEDTYLIGRGYYLLRSLKIKKENAIIFTLKEILEIASLIKYNYFRSEMYVSVVDTINKKIRVCNVKKNILVSELLSKLKIDKEDYCYIKNGLYTGKKINYNKEIIDEGFESLFIVDRSFFKEDKCINCGKCVSVCEMKINPKKMKELGLVDERCINCGLCSYFCPSNRKLNLICEVKDEENN